ncbi:MAG: sigma 54-interacting transcriptional regulator [Myxococcales bacterium]|nr:sigma 54-interacting transcriptional regulator [Myxococcales bacterium]
MTASGGASEPAPAVGTPAIGAGKALPARYEPIRRLGAGGGGEVWAVRDRLDGRTLALKALPPGASDPQEVAALVREATTLLDLSTSTGNLLPGVERFGRLADGRPFLVRELVEGASLQSLLDRGGGLLVATRALLGAASQLTLLHRAGLLHGDIKPANVIVRPDGTATLVDLGLATTWGPRGARVEGLTPRFAAPELFEGEPLTVRGEVFALGASLRDVLDACTGGERSMIVALREIERRATARDPSVRHPSVDELGASIAAACGFPAEHSGPRGIWTVRGVESVLADLVHALDGIATGEELSVVGPVGVGGRTVLAALAFRLGLGGWPVAWLRGPFDRTALALELATAIGATTASATSFAVHGGVLVVHDPEGAEEALAELRRAGARIVVRRTAARPGEGVRVFTVPPLEERELAEIARRALPSLPEAVLGRVVGRSDGLPGRLRAIVAAIGDRAIVRAESVDVIVAHIDRTGGAPLPEAPVTVERVRELLDAARVSEAEALLAGLPDDGRTALLRGWIALGKADLAGARALLDSVDPAGDHGLLAERALLAAKVENRAAAYDQVAAQAAIVLALEGDPAVSGAVVAEAYQARGVARMYQRDDAGAVEDLTRASRIAREAGAQRIEAMAFASLAMAHQRAGRAKDARAAYDASITAAEAANDAAAVALARLNLGTLAWSEGDLAEAISAFEAAADLGRRVQRNSTVERALLNLAVVDLGLGRYARVGATLKNLTAMEAQMTPVGQAQLLGVRAELESRIGDVQRASGLFAETAACWRAIGRPGDAAEVEIDGVLLRCQRDTPSATGASSVRIDEEQRILDAAEAELGARAGELAAPLTLARGLVAAHRGDEQGALAAFDKAIAAAKDAKDWLWQVYAARARVLSSQGSHARARRDADQAAAVLEEIAEKLSRDLREVFWDEPRRRALRQVHEVTQLNTRATMAPASGMPLTPPSGIMGATMASGTIGPPTAISGGSTQFVRLAEDRLARILAVNRDLACEADLGRLLARVTDQALDLLGADRGFVLLAGEEESATSEGDSQPGELSARVARDRRKDDPSVQFSRSIAERVLETGEAIVTNNARTDARLGGAASIHALSIHSVACVPIPRVRGGDRRPIGVLYLETRGPRAGREGMETELPTLLAFADQVGIAIANARLVEENRRRADELAKANEELEQARARLDDALARRTEQLERAKADLGAARQALRGHTGYAGYKGLVGTSAPMRKLYALIDRIRQADVPVLLAGESGTGKEVVARAIHNGSTRAKRPFLGVNCGAIPANLLESELFGHVRGAFTGADRERKGLFRETEGGTILLDEIGEMPLKMQAGLLRVLQEKTVRPVGGSKEEPVDARVICATHRDLDEMVARNEFREDLFYRINVVVLRLPSLRERPEDIPLLADHFLGVFAAHYRREKKALSREAVRKLQGYPWPGNVRQLENLLLNAFVLSEGALIESSDLAFPEPSRSAPPSRPESLAPSSGEDDRPASLESFKRTEKDRILEALERAGWNRLQAAKICGIPRRTFYRRLKEYGIQE